LKTQLHNSKACRNPASKAKAYRGCILVCPGKKAFNFIKKDYPRLDLPGSIKKGSHFLLTLTNPF